MSIFNRMFKRKPDLKITVFYHTHKGTTKAKSLTVHELTTEHGVYEIALDYCQSIRVEVQK